MLSDRLPHPDRGKAGAVGIAVRGSGGKKGRLLPDGTFVPTEHIVESIRDLMSDSTPDGDIKRILAAKFGGKGASFAKHIALARKRNLCQLDREPHEAKADSVQQWQRALAEAKADKRRAAANLKAAQDELTALRKYYRETVIDGDGVLEMMRNIGAKEQAVFDAEEAFNSARHHVDKYQDRLDKLFGNHAPIKYDTNNKSEISGELKIEASREPLTAAEADAELMGIIQKMKETAAEKATVGARAEASKQGSN